MKLLKVLRKSTFENRFSPKMGRLISKVTRIKLLLLGIPIKTIHEYRDTYYGKVKDVEDCDIEK